mgnify:CR=1 FL=1
MRAIGIILAGGNNYRMKELSHKRAIAAMPVAGCYRAIDFTLSNMTNSRITKVGVITQYNARSLNEHLSSSKWWDFGRKQGGLYVFTPAVTADNSNWYRGTADAIYQNLNFLKSSHEPYVGISSGDCVYKLDFGKVLEYHIDKKADITVVCRDMEPDANIERYGTVVLNEDNRIEEFEEKPIQAKTNTISCGIYVIRRRLLIEMIEKCAEEEEGEAEDHKDDVEHPKLLPVAIVDQYGDCDEHDAQRDADKGAVLGAAPELGQPRRLRAIRIIPVIVSICHTRHLSILPQFHFHNSMIYSLKTHRPVAPKGAAAIQPQTTSFSTKVCLLQRHRANQSTISRILCQKAPVLP